jgi:hypothetical protein
MEVARSKHASSTVGANLDLPILIPLSIEGLLIITNESIVLLCTKNFTFPVTTLRVCTRVFPRHVQGVVAQIHGIMGE